jgi:rhomboid protease GluP
MVHDPPDDAPPLLALRLPIGADPRDWALVLEAEGIGFQWGREADGSRLILVPADEAERAAAQLTAWIAENAALPALPAASRHGGGAWLGLGWAMALLLFFVVTGDARPESWWLQAGRAEAGLILGGQPWRTVTALTLHADLSHVLSNAIAGGLLTVAVGTALGPGLAILAILLSGMGGNAVTAFLRPLAGSSIGASTAVFGAVGLLAGLALDRRRRAGWAGERLWLPVLAGLGLLALMGTAPDTDVLAHSLGLVAGIPLGACFGLVERRWGRRGGQWTAAVLSLLLLGGSWLAATLP